MVNRVGHDEGMEPLLRPPIGFAHRGASAHAPENTLEAFRLALRLGASGLESDVWLTADGVAVLDHDGVVRSGLRRRPIAGLRPGRPARPHPHPRGPLRRVRHRLPAVPRRQGRRPPPPRSIAVARAAGGDAVGRLWLCHPDWEQVARGGPSPTRSSWSTRPGCGGSRRAPSAGPPPWPTLGVDAVNMHATDWTGGLTTLFHRFERLAFGWDAQFERVLQSACWRWAATPSTATTSTGWWTRYNRPIDESGQTRTKARPTIRISGMAPMNRLSLELVRLSPITKY